MNTETEKRVLLANENFYYALNKGDLPLMEESWVNDSTVKCVHPGWPLISGWENVRDSWENIFSSETIANVEISEVFIDVKDDSAWVNCVERLSHVVEERILITHVQTTNIFKLVDSKWRIVLHHASPMPVPRSELEDELMQ